MKKIILPTLPPCPNQCELINKIFFDIDFEEKKKIISKIQKKINGYKQQDKKKNRFNKYDFITYNDLMEKLVISKLRCFYCRKDILINYDMNRDPRQWTLDRIDNKTGHNTTNVVISCLKCNLEKRTRCSNKFKFTKQMKIIKKII